MTDDNKLKSGVDDSIVPRMHVTMFYDKDKKRKRSPCLVLVGQTHKSFSNRLHFFTFLLPLLTNFQRALYLPTCFLALTHQMFYMLAYCEFTSNLMRKCVPVLKTPTHQGFYRNRVPYL